MQEHLKNAPRELKKGNHGSNNRTLKQSQLGNYSDKTYPNVAEAPSTALLD
jgi:hypothetical protein